ncbi:hypothetical protein [Anaerospora sp.]|uniref:hypothetical protein n=1 Tax=Anaerospora sp. TaxID=1960278 RepID=UPI00289B4B10|nr:hypothetical protein [Anaerospora sp.]
MNVKKKKAIAIAAAACAVVSLSAADVAAAKVKDDIFDITWSTKTKYEWVESDEMKNKTEVKTLITARPDPETMFGMQLKFKQSNNNDKLTESNKITLEDVWLERKISDTFTARVGSMPLSIGPGLWMDGDGLAGLGATWKPDQSNTFYVVAGKDSQEDTVKTIKSVSPVYGDPSKPDKVTGTKLNYVTEGSTSIFQAVAWDHEYTKGNYGLYVGRQDVSKYRGAFASYALTNNLVFTTEYVKNIGVKYNDKNTTSKVAELKLGKTKKVGDTQYVATYLDSDPGVFVSADYTAWDDNYNEETGFKGIGATINHRISKSTVLQLEHFWGEFKATGDSWQNTGIKITAKF